jgi:hypothetical protein
MHGTRRIGAMTTGALRQAGTELRWNNRQRCRLAEKPDNRDRAEGTTHPCHAESKLAPRTNLVNEAHLDEAAIG